MLKKIWMLTGLLAISGSAVALTKSEIRVIIEDNYPNAFITEIEKARYQGKKSTKSISSMEVRRLKL
jgi:hypothetical protein